MKKVVVKSHPETGAVITVSKNNPEWGTVRIDETTAEVKNGIITPKVRTAFLRGKVADLNQLGLVAGQPFPLEGKVVRKESFSPFYDGQEPKQSPEGVVAKKEGKPIYMSNEFTTNLSEADELIQHDNVEEFRVAAAKAKAAQGAETELNIR